MKILVIQQKMIGDVLATSILFESLRNKYPQAELHYVINSHTYPVVENNPFIDRLVFISPEIEKNKLKFFSFLRTVKKEKYDVVIDVYNKISSNLITLFSRANVTISTFKWYTSFIYSNTIKERKKAATAAGLAIENRLQLLSFLDDNQTAVISPKIYLTLKEKKLAKDLLIQSKIDLSKSLFMISVLGSSNNKTYPIKYMAKLIDVIVEETNGQILFNYIPNQKNEAKAVYNICKKETQQHIYFNVFGKNLREFLAITQHCDALIGNEGGATNMSKAMNIRTFTIFSPWIIKEAWNMFEESKNHISVHLKDFHPEFYTEHPKKYKKESLNLYQQFTPNYIEPALKKFLLNLY